jgi:prepilin-type N-terminal cleavage/methylation domain-containing protein
MKKQIRQSQRFHGAFTLVEMLVVISIIGTLAALLLPVVGQVKRKAQIRAAQVDIGNIMAAINAYDQQYSRLPASTNALYRSANHNPTEDCTFGGPFSTPHDGPITIQSAWYVPATPYNAEVIAILMDWEYYPNGQPTVNLGHIYNPQQIKFLNAKLSGDSKLAGVDPSGVFRDPWGTPYVITLDLNYDEYSRDFFYRQDGVANPSGSGGPLVGLIKRTDSTGEPVYEAHARAMVWSAGPDKMVDPKSAANAGANKDNILSWTQ